NARYRLDERRRDHQFPYWDAQVWATARLQGANKCSSTLSLELLETGIVRHYELPLVVDRSSPTIGARAAISPPTSTHGGSARSSLATDTCGVIREHVVRGHQRSA